ncbi:kinase-like domain-containing protein [Cantharellus anzutake]|uniref:kinase-like domain-containing protein n=1 Tax=Cantharellus anzutake TaxID=1750568 RepID=UPI001902C959|nr:kinase-like domain-containing protein [Cantharellus anzutake]KAF8325188.1 kinase-like domain-containing protein [Cantharellus anzutake]
MSPSLRTWRERRNELVSILEVAGCDEHKAPGHVDPVALAVEECSRLSRQLRCTVESLRFSDSDFSFICNFDRGQFGALEAVRCVHDGKVYARKCVQKSTAERYKDQCFVKTEREILSRATVTKCPWVIWLLCAFQTPMALVLVMEYAAGGSLWDLIASVPDSKVTEADLRWWVPQAINSIDWCHAQGFSHRDIKPHNFVISQDARLKLIDFGCAAPLVSTSSKPPRHVAKPYCLIPCGTCDYISPEILQAHEDALFAAEIDGHVEVSMHERGYGCETDWWSLGAVIYELALGVAPFFAPNIQQTYSRIVQHEGSDIGFDEAVPLSLTLCDLIRRLLTTADERLGVGGTNDIRRHPWFAKISWSTLDQRPAPPNLFFPPENQYSCTSNELDLSQDKSSPFDFSHLFKSSMNSSAIDQSYRGPSAQSMPAYTGFSWGPMPDAFDVSASARLTAPSITKGTPMPAHVLPPDLGTLANGARRKDGRAYGLGTLTPSLRAPPKQPSPKDFKTPNRPTVSYHDISMPRTEERRGMSSSHRKRLISDREALMQMMALVSASARKKKREANRPNDLNTSISFDESAPPSPSPRPGSSLSRRSGSASPFPHVRNAALSFVFDPPTLTLTGTSRSLSNHASRVPNPTLLEDGKREERSDSFSQLFPPKGDDSRRHEEEKDKGARAVVDTGTLDTLSSRTYWTGSLDENSSTVDVRLVEASITKLLTDLSRMESKVASLKAFAQNDAH